MSIIRNVLEGKDFSKETIDLIYNSWRGSTKTKHKTDLYNWCCSCNKIDLLQPTVVQAVEYLTYFHNHNFTYNQI